MSGEIIIIKKNQCMKQYHLIKRSLASGELLEPLVSEEKAVLMPFGRIPMKILHNWAELQPEGRRNQELAIVLSSLLWCFNFRPDIYVVRFQTLPWFLCAAFPRTRTNFRKAICSSVKTSNISLVPSSFFFLLFNKSHHFWCLFKDFFFPLVMVGLGFLDHHCFPSQVFDRADISLEQRLQPWLAAPKALGMMCEHNGNLHSINYLHDHLTARAKGHWLPSMVWQ